MKKEAVSRCLKSLYEKDCILNSGSHLMSGATSCLSPRPGLAALKQGYESILQPFYDLWRSAGKDFEMFMYYADKLAAHMEEGHENKRTMKFYDALQMDPAVLKRKSPPVAQAGKSCITGRLWPYARR